MLIIEHPQDRRARRTQDAIIAAAVSLILEKGAGFPHNPGYYGTGGLQPWNLIYIFPANRSCCSSFWMISCREWGELMQNFITQLTEVDMTVLLPSTMPVFEYIEAHQDIFRALITMNSDMSSRLCNMFRTYQPKILYW